LPFFRFYSGTTLKKWNESPIPMGTIFPLRIKKCRQIQHSPSNRRPNGESDRLYIHLWIEGKTLLREEISG